MSRYFRSGLNRTVCDILEEIRSLDKTRNYSALMGLVEEVQVLANRMEAALNDNQDWRHARKELKALEKDIKALESRKKELEDE